MKNKQSSTKGIIVAFFFSCFLIISAEFLIYCFLPQSRLDQILDVLQRDSHYIWKQKPNMRTDFFGEEIITDELGLRNKVSLSKKDKLRMLILGASPTFGWGVPQNKTYAKVLENEFDSKLEIINAAHIGHSSHQGLLFLKEHIKTLKPDIVTIPYVINDVDRYRFFENTGGPDHQKGSANKIKIQISNFINRFQLTRLLRSIATYVKQRQTHVIPNAFKYKQARVPLDRYKKNLDSFIELSKEFNFKIIFIKMPVNLPIGPNSHELSIFENIIKHPCSARIDLANKLLTTSPLQPELFHIKAICLSQLGKLDKLNETIQQLKKIQSHRAARDAIKYNAYMDFLAKENNLPLVDIVALFNKHKGDYLFVDKKLDTIHPNDLGHALIAKELSRYLRPLIPSMN